MQALASNSDTITGRPSGAGETRPGRLDRVSLPSALPDPADLLAARREDLLAQLADIAQDDDAGRPRFSNHLAEDAQDQQELRSAAALRQLLNNDLHQVEHALSRANAGDYGLCEECGHEIPPRRLQAIPTATLCVDCQGRREVRHAVH